MRTKATLKNIIASFSLQLVQMAIGFVLPRTMLVVYGSVINGLVSSIRQFINYFSIVEAGISAVATHALYKPLAENSTEKINAILSAAQKYYTRSGWMFLGLILTLAVIFPFAVKGQISYGFTAIMVVILGISGVLEFFVMRKFRVLLTAAQKSYIISTAQIISSIINFLIIYFLAVNRVNVALVYSLAIFSIIIRLVILSIYVNKYFPKINYNEKPDENALINRYDALFQQVLNIIQMAVPITLITIFCGLKEVSVYSIYYMIFGALNSLLLVFNNSVYPSFGDVISRRQIETLRDTYSIYETLFFVILSWCYSSAAILITPFVSIYTKGVQDVVYVRPVLAIIFVLSGLSYNIKTVLGSLIISAGHFRQTRYRALLQGIINILVSLMLVKPFGIIGVLIGGICSDIYRALDLVFYVSKNILKANPLATFGRMVKMLFTFLISVLPFITPIKISPNRYGEWFITAFIVALWCAAVSIVCNICLNRNTMINLYRRVLLLMGEQRK